jgi:hypothetical protein
VARFGFIGGKVVEEEKVLAWRILLKSRHKGFIFPLFQWINSENTKTFVIEMK